MGSIIEMAEDDNNSDLSGAFEENIDIGNFPLTQHDTPYRVSRE